MPEIITSPRGLGLKTGKTPLPATHGAGDAFIVWLTNMLDDFKQNGAELFTAVAFARQDILEVGSGNSPDYLLFFPATAEGNGHPFKTLLAVSAEDGNYMMDGSSKICLSGKIIDLSSQLDFKDVLLTSKKVFLNGKPRTNGNPVWSTDKNFEGPLTDWIKSLAPGDTGLPFKCISIGLDDVKKIFEIPKCKWLGLIPVTLLRQKTGDAQPVKKNTLLMVGLDSENNILLQDGNSLWVCADAATKGDKYPPWRTKDLKITTTL